MVIYGDHSCQNAKEKILSQVLKNDRVIFCLDELVKFPGHRFGLQLGNFHKHLALHCDKQIVNYLYPRDAGVAEDYRKPGC